MTADLSKYCTKCDKFGDHWASECPKSGGVYDDWSKTHPGSAAALNIMYHRESE